MSSKKEKSYIYFTIIYKPNKSNTGKIRIFGENFVTKNRDKCKIIYEEKEFELTEYFEDLNNNKFLFIDLIILILKIDDNNITDISYMFSECNTLLSIHPYNLESINTDDKNMNTIPDDLQKNTILNEELNETQTSNEKYQQFYGYNNDSLKSLSFSHISNTSNKINESYNSIKSLNDKLRFKIYPDISKLNTSKVTNISHMFHRCSKLISLPDISKWDTSNVIDMSNLFYNCNSLKSIPDISNWNTKSVTNMFGIFYRCSLLSSFPDISKWNTEKVTNMGSMFYNCFSLLSFPNLLKWDISKNNLNKDRIFDGCINCLNNIEL